MAQSLAVLPDQSIDPGQIPSMSDGLTVPQLENILSDIRFQPVWRLEADKCADYYDGHQITQERLDKMSRLGIPPLVTNLIAPAINAVLGTEAKTRTDWRVTEEDETQEVPGELMQAMNAKLSEAERESRSDRSCSDAYAKQLKAGLGWVEVSRAVDAFAYPYRVQETDRNEIWWDWRAKQPDLSDARYLIRKRRFDADELTAMMPEHADLIQFAVQDAFKTWQWDTRATWDTQLAYAAEIERITNIDASEWRDAERKRAMLYEVWYRKWVRDYVLKLPNGKVIPFDQKNDRQVAAVNAGIITPLQGVYTNVRVAFYLGPHRLYDVPTPYRHRHFPYVPFWGYREDRSKVPYGLIRSMMSPQDVVNSADAKMHWMMNARRLRIDSDALDTKYNTIRQVQEELARPDAVIITDPSKPNSRLMIDQDFELNSQQYMRRQQSANDINNAGGVYKAFQGSETASKSGIALNSLVEQSSVTLAEINDNYQFARRQVGELLFSLVREDLLGSEIPVAYKKGGKKVVVYLNQKVTDPATGQTVIKNDVSKVPVKVALEDIPSTPAFRAQQLQIISQVTSSMPPNMQALIAPFLIKLTDVPDRDEIYALVRKAAGIPADTSPEATAAAEQQANAAAADAQQIARAAAITKVKKDDADANLSEAKAAQISSQVPMVPVDPLAPQTQPAAPPEQQPPVQPPPDVTWR